MITTLEKLEKKLGKSPRTIADHQLVCERALENPASLNELDHATLEYFGTPPAVKAALDAVKAVPSTTTSAPTDDETLRLAVGAIVELDQFVDDMNEKNKERNSRLDEFEKRIAQLEARPSMEYRGVHEAGKTYMHGDTVTKNGSLWIAKLNSLKSEPGKDPVGWQLCVRAGRDAR